MKHSSTKSGSTVKLHILLSIALKNLTSKKLRTGLTLFGVATGIGSVFFLMSFGIGLQKLVTDQVIGSQSIKTIDVSSPNSKVVKLDDVTTQRIKNIPEVDSIGKAYYFPGSFKVSNSESDSIVYGIDAGYEKLTILNLVAGNLLSASNEKSPLVLNNSALKAIGLSKNPKEVIGKTISIIVPLNKAGEKLGTFTHDFTVVGVIDSGSGAEIFIPTSFFHDLGVTNLTQLKVGVNNVSVIQKIRTQIESFGFETSSPIDTLNEINSIFRYFTLILVGFGAIGMFIAVIGMLNTLTISLLERTKEIGLMVALGARSIDMRRLFMFEALLLAILGTIFGNLGAMTVGVIANTIINAFAHKRGIEATIHVFSYPLWLTALSFVFMIAVGFAVVYLPARRAEKINPIDALRRE